MTTTSFLKLKREFCNTYNNLPMDEASNYHAFYTDLDSDNENEFLKWCHIEELVQQVENIRHTKERCDQVEEVINRRPLNERDD